MQCLGLPAQVADLRIEAQHSHLSVASGLPHVVSLLFLIAFAVFTLRGELLMRWQRVTLIISGYLLF